MFQENVKDVSRKFKGCFKEDERGVSREFLVGFRGISRKFHMCFKEVSRVFQERF